MDAIDATVVFITLGKRSGSASSGETVTSLETTPLLCDVIMTE